MPLFDLPFLADQHRDDRRLIHSFHWEDLEEIGQLSILVLDSSPLGGSGDQHHLQASLFQPGSKLMAHGVFIILGSPQAYHGDGVIDDQYWWTVTRTFYG